MRNYLKDGRLKIDNNLAEKCDSSDSLIKKKLLILWKP